MYFSMFEEFFQEIKYRSRRNHQNSVSTAVFLSLNFTDVPIGSHTIEVIENLHDGSQASASISFTTNFPDA